MNKTMDIKSKSFTNYLKDLSNKAPITQEDRKELSISLSNLISIKETIVKTLTPEEREHITNWRYLLFTIDIIKDTIKNFDIITKPNYRYNTLINYIRGHQLSQDQAKELFNQYTCR